MSSWSDMTTVKQNLWKKLHTANQMVSDGVTNLAQIVQAGKKKISKIASMPFEDVSFVQIEADSPDVLKPQFESESAKVKKAKRISPHEYYQGVTSVKHMNTQRTMVLYFCIMTVLLFCCLGRCLVVPMSQASKYELNSRKHMAKLDKNAFLQ